MASRVHVPVLLEETLHWLDPQPGDFFVDGTLGAGGHTRALAERVGPAGCVLSFDRDPAALAAAEENLRGLPVKIVHANFAELPQILAQEELPPAKGILVDLGLSSDQLADRERGFSFDAEGPLDMRFDPESGESAWQLIQRLPEKALADLIYKYGEEHASRRIAKALCEFRKTQFTCTAKELAEVIYSAIGRKQFRDRIDPATKTFQALRIAVNKELDSLESALARFPTCLKPGGRLAVISFHSLEDRPVKQAFLATPWKVLTKKPVVAAEEEIERNPRSRSAKLRVAERA